MRKRKVGGDLRAAPQTLRCVPLLAGWSGAERTAVGKIERLLLRLRMQP